jgi:hypothetical protein
MFVLFLLLATWLLTQNVNKEESNYYFATILQGVMSVSEDQILSTKVHRLIHIV